MPPPAPPASSEKKREMEPEKRWHGDAPARKRRAASRAI